MPIILDVSKCVDCGNCMSACPNGAIINDNGHAKLIPERCDGCGACDGECPVDAISVDQPLNATAMREVMT